jgi:hypothetical protein
VWIEELEPVGKLALLEPVVVQLVVQLAVHVGQL